MDQQSEREQEIAEIEEEIEEISAAESYFESEGLWLNRKPKAYQRTIERLRRILAYRRKGMKQ